MKIEDFIKDDKLTVPEDEIDNIYIWTKVANTTKALLPAKAYYRLAKDAFDKDLKRITDVVKSNNSWANDATYELSDYLAIQANKSKLFNSDCCFLYSNDKTVLTSILFYLAQTKNLYKSTSHTLSDLLMTHVSDQESFTDATNSDTLFLTAYAPLPEHKLKEYFLDALASRRRKPHKYTLVHTMTKACLIGPSGYSEKYPLLDNFIKDVTPLSALMLKRRQQDYKAIMSYWLSMMKFSPELFVYSKVQPEEKLRKINRYEQ